MKKKPLLLICLVLQMGFIQAQHDRALVLSGSLYDLWNGGQINQAIQSSVELFQLQPTSLLDQIHYNLSQQLANKRNITHKNCVQYLEGLYAVNNPTLQELLRPIYLWNKVLNTDSESDLMNHIAAFQQVLGNKSNFESKAERYGLLVFHQIEKNETIDQTTKQAFLDKIIANLEAFPYIKAVGEVSKRAWHRYLLAHSYYQYYKKWGAREDLLQKAALYSPDLYDKQRESAYTSDIALLKRYLANHKNSYQLEYIDYLKKQSRTEEALTLLTEWTFNEPIDAYMQELKTIYRQSPNTATFKTYWMNYIHEKTQQTPTFTIESKDGQTTNIPQNTWVFLDFWGTWCRPCVKELPALEQWYRATRSLSSIDLKVYTLSHDSYNLRNFMKKNAYTFPVVEIGDQTLTAFKVMAFPKKFLITPKGHFLRLPSGVDWRMYVKNYLLM